MTPIQRIKFRFVFVYHTMAYKFSNLLDRLYFWPKFKVGDLLEYDLSYAKVVFRVDAIKRSDIGGAEFYNLIGVKILSDKGTNPYKTEAKRYNPFCRWFDKKAVKFEGAL